MCDRGPHVRSISLNHASHANGNGNGGCEGEKCQKKVNAPRTSNTPTVSEIFAGGKVGSEVGSTGSCLTYLEGHFAGPNVSLIV